MFDVTGRKAREDDLARQANLHGVVADLGSHALTSPSLQSFFDTAVDKVARAVNAPLVMILEQPRGGSALVSRSLRGFGNAVPAVELKEGEHPAAESVLERGNAALIPDLAAHTKGRVPAVLSQAGAISGAIAAIRGEEGVPFGTIEIYDRRLNAYRGTEREFLVSVANIVGYCIARLQAARNLSDSEERFRTLVESAPVGICILQDDQVVFMNPSQEEVLGAGRAPFPLPEMENVFHPSDAFLFRRKYEAMCSGTADLSDQDLRVLCQSRDCGGEVCWMNTRMTPIQWRGAPAVLMSMSDVSKTKEMELITLKQERMATLGRVASGIAHEVRSPLSALNVLLSGLKRAVEVADGMAPETRGAILRSVEKLHGASGKIEGVIRRALDFSRPLAVPMAPLSINEAIRESLTIAESLLARSGIEVVTSLREDLPPCRGDKRLLEQVLLNLLTNAAQAMEGRDGKRRIRVTSAMENGEIAVAVADTGPGIPEEFREKVFEPFFTTRGSGTGIGLSISRKIVSEHGGTLRAGASEQGGALFTILLPPLAAHPSS
jgi:PAS domain S-box-containing protein